MKITSTPFFWYNSSTNCKIDTSLKKALSATQWAELADQAQREFNCFQVEKIVDHGINDDDEYELKVRWDGFTSKDDTWEPAQSLFADVPAVVINYFQKVLPDDAAEIISSLKAAWPIPSLFCLNIILSSEGGVTYSSYGLTDFIPFGLCYI